MTNVYDLFECILSVHFQWIAILYYLVIQYHMNERKWKLTSSICSFALFGLKQRYEQHQCKKWSFYNKLEEEKCKLLHDVIFFLCLRCVLNIQHLPTWNDIYSYWMRDMLIENKLIHWIQISVPLKTDDEWMCNKKKILVF